jgi:hypothetical protein
MFELNVNLVCWYTVVQHGCDMRGIIKEGDGAVRRGF